MTTFLQSFIIIFLSRIKVQIPPFIFANNHNYVFLRSYPDLN